MTQPTPDGITDASQPADIPRELTLAGAPVGKPVPAPPDATPPRDDKVVDLTHLAGHFEYGLQLQDQVDALKKKLKEVTDTIKAAMGDCTVAVVEGSQEVTWRWHEQTRLVPEIVRQNDPALAAVATEKKPQRTFLWVKRGQA